MSKKFSDFESPSGINDADEVVGLGAGVNSRWSFADVGAYVQGFLAAVFLGIEVAIADLNSDLDALTAAFDEQNYELGSLTYSVYMIDVNKVEKSGDAMTGQLHMNFAAAQGFGHIKLGVSGLIQIWGSGTDTIVFEYNSVNIAIFQPGSFTVQNAGGTTTSFSVIGESTTSGTIERDDNTATGPALSFRKARGAIAARAIVATNDTLGSLNFNAYDGATSRTAGTFHVRITEVTPGTTALGSQYRFNCFPAGSVTSTEVHRMDHTGGLQAFGANTYLTPNRALRTRGTTLATIAGFTSATADIYFATDLGGGSNLVVYDGTRIKRAANRGYAAVATDADFTLTVLTSSGMIRHTGTLTNNRVVTLSTTNAGAGDEFLITRTGAGAFNLDIGGLKNLTTGTWCRVHYDGAAWFLSAYGAL